MLAVFSIFRFRLKLRIFSIVFLPFLVKVELNLLDILGVSEPEILFHFSIKCSWYFFSCLVEVMLKLLEDENFSLFDRWNLHAELLGIFGFKWSWFFTYFWLKWRWLFFIHFWSLVIFIFFNVSGGIGFLQHFNCYF